MIDSKDFTSLINKVNELKTVFEQLKKDVPRLELQKQGILDEIKELNGRKIELQKEIEDTEIEVATALKVCDEEVDKKYAKLEKAEADFEAKKKKSLKNIDDETLLLEQRKHDCNTTEEAQRQVSEDIEAKFQELCVRVDNIDKMSVELTEGQAKYLEDVGKLAVDREELDKQITEFEKIKTDILERDKKSKEQSDIILRQRSDCQKVAEKQKEESRVILMKSDDLARREKLVADKEIRLKRDESALKEKIAIYESHLR